MTRLDIVGGTSKNYVIKSECLENMLFEFVAVSQSVRVKDRAYELQSERKLSLAI